MSKYLQANSNLGAPTGEESPQCSYTTLRLRSSGSSGRLVAPHTFWVAPDPHVSPPRDDRGTTHQHTTHPSSLNPLPPNCPLHLPGSHHFYKVSCFPPLLFFFPSCSPIYANNTNAAQHHSTSLHVLGIHTRFFRSLCTPYNFTYQTKSPLPTYPPPPSRQSDRTHLHRQDDYTTKTTKTRKRKKKRRPAKS